MSYYRRIKRLEQLSLDLTNKKNELARKTNRLSIIQNPRHIANIAIEAQRVFQRLTTIKQKIRFLKRMEKLEKTMSRETIMDLASKIKPMMRMVNGELKFAPNATNEGVLFWIESKPIHSSSFTSATTGAIRKVEGLQEIARIKTYHNYGGYYGLLKPSVDEAILQCPQKILDKVCAFEFEVSSFNLANIFDPDLEMHCLTTVYYTGELPEDIANQEVIW